GPSGLSSAGPYPRSRHDNQSWGSGIDVTTLTGGSQHVPDGFVASQEAIKLLGTNGGGYFNANSAHHDAVSLPSSKLKKN
ncbi:potassium-transporting ATPase subunit KdpA, partial [Bacillus sp. S34]|nr:potassium-transporting ATPase subunit KdpA [Bacillus sp. S34]